jgi:phospholipid transport system substrate-binding protein
MKKSNERNVNIFIAIFLLLSILISYAALATTDTPEMKVKAVFGQIESSLMSLKSKDQFTKINIRGVLNKYFLPEVNTRFFSYKILNKNLTKIPSELKDEFVTELSAQLINTYSHLLSKSNNESINIGASSLSESGRIAMVKITIVGNNKTNKAVVKLLKSKAETWQFFDIMIEGISLLDTKQKELNSSFKRLGIEGTLLHLKSINQRALIS